MMEFMLNTSLKLIIHCSNEFNTASKTYEQYYHRKSTIKNGEFLCGDSMRILDDSTPFTIKEAFRTLYTNILYLPIEDKTKKIAITSAFPGEGKTYTSTNLAITIAQNSDNRRVLLIDMDMRKSSISKILDNLQEY